MISGCIQDEFYRSVSRKISLLEIRKTISATDRRGLFWTPEKWRVSHTFWYRSSQASHTELGYLLMEWLCSPRGKRTFATTQPASLLDSWHCSRIWWTEDPYRSGRSFKWAELHGGEPAAGAGALDGFHMQMTLLDNNSAIVLANMAWSWGRTKSLSYFTSHLSNLGGLSYALIPFLTSII